MKFFKIVFHKNLGKKNLSNVPLAEIPQRGYS